MTDTAAPLPEIAIELRETEPILTLDQRRRVEALQIARQILESKAALFAGSKVSDSRAIWELTTLADWIIDGPPDDDEPVSLQTSRDASNKAYFDSGWNAVRREALAVDEQMGPQLAIDWIREHPAGGRPDDSEQEPEADADDGV